MPLAKTMAGCKKSEDKTDHKVGLLVGSLFCALDKICAANFDRQKTPQLNAVTTAYFLATNGPIHRTGKDVDLYI